MLWFVIVFVFFGYYFYTRLSCGITKSSTCLIDKTAIITGANSGLGYQTALNLASRGCRVIMADVADMEESKRNIIKYTKNPNIHIENLDLSSLKSVRKFAARILKNESRLDILINNAGILGLDTISTKTKDGLQSVMQINYFGHFLLTHLLIDLLKKSSPSRIVFTCSSAFFINSLTVENLNAHNKHNSIIDKYFCYSNSKLALLIASDILAKKLKNTGVTSNTIHPGCVATPILRNVYNLYPKRISFVLLLLSPIYIKDPWEGSQTLLHVAISRKLENVTGKFFWDCKPYFKPAKAYDREFCQRIWEATEKYVGLKPDEKLM